MNVNVTRWERNDGPSICLTRLDSSKNKALMDKVNNLLIRFLNLLKKKTFKKF